MQDDLECQEVILDDDEMPIEHVKSTKQPIEGAKKLTKHARLENTENYLWRRLLNALIKQLQIQR